MNAYEQKVQIRLARMRASAARKRADGEASIAGARKMAAVIPLGQPILLGHHSERRDRNYRGRIEGQFRKGFENLEEARDLERRADAAESNTSISSDDPDAVTKLKDKLAGIETFRAKAVKLNARIRTAKRHAEKAGTDWKVVARGALAEIGLKAATIEAVMIPNGFGDVGVPAYKLTNLSSEARRITARIKELEAAAAAPEREPELFGEVRLEEGDNRVRLVFPGKPDDKVRGLLKSRGFRWSPRAGAWQRQATDNARLDARELARMIAG